MVSFPFQPIQMFKLPVNLRSSTVIDYAVQWNVAKQRYEQIK